MVNLCIKKLFGSFLSKREMLILSVLILFFVLKTTLLAFFITPLWSIPDEKGHFSYGYHIASGKGLPILGEARMADILNKHIESENNLPLNHIAQHPPLYYLLLAAPIKLMMVIDAPEDWLFYFPRIINIMLGTLSLIFMYKFFAEVNKNFWHSILLVSIPLFTPLYGSLTSGMTNDILLVFLVCVASLYWFRLMKSNDKKNALYMGLFLSLALLTKITAIAIVIPMLVSILLWPFAQLKSRIYFFIWSSICSFFFPFIWFFTNIIRFGSPIVRAGTVLEWSNSEPVNITYLEYLRNTSGLQTTFKWFFAWFSKSDFASITLTDDFFPIVSFIVLFFVCLSYIAYLIILYKHKSILAYILLAFSVIVSLLFYIFVFSGESLSFLFSIMFGMVICFVFIFLKRNLDFQHSTMFCSLFIIFVFFATYLYQLVDVYKEYAEMRATQGRYWYPILPFLLIGIVYPGLKRLNIKKNIIFPLILLFLFLELTYYLYCVMPLYQGVTI